MNTGRDSERASERFLFLAIAVIGVVGLGMLIGGGTWLGITIAKVSSSQTVTGVVVDRVEVIRPKDTNDLYAITVRYEVDGKEYRYRPGAMYPAPQVGESVTVRYQADDPSDAMLGGAMSWFGQLTLLAIGLIMTAFAVLFVWIARAQRRQAADDAETEDRIRQYGRRVRATVDFAGHQESGWLLTATYTDPESGARRFVEHRYDGMPDVMPDVGSQVNVLLDPDDPGRYLVDVE